MVWFALSFRAESTVALARSTVKSPPFKRDLANSAALESEIDPDAPSEVQFDGMKQDRASAAPTTARYAHRWRFAVQGERSDAPEIVSTSLAYRGRDLVNSIEGTVSALRDSRLFSEIQRTSKTLACNAARNDRYLMSAPSICGAPKRSKSSRNSDVI